MIRSHHVLRVPAFENQNEKFARVVSALWAGLSACLKLETDYSRLHSVADTEPAFLVALDHPFCEHLWNSFLYVIPHSAPHPRASVCSLTIFLRGS